MLLRNRLLLTAMFIIMLFPVLDAGASVVTDGLANWWKFEQSSSPLIDSVGNNFATAVNCRYRQLGYRNYGIRSIGGYAVLSNNVNLSEITIEAWIKPEMLSSTYGPIFQNLNFSNDRGYAMMFYSSLNSLRFYVGNEYITANNTGITTGNWHHLVATYSNVTHTAKLYINGIQKAIKTGITTPAMFSGGTPRIGQYNNIYCLNGYIDDVRIYNRALLNTEILQNYNASGFSWVPSSKVLILDSRTLTVNIQGGGIVYIKNKKTGDVYTNTSDPWSLFDEIKSGILLDWAGNSRKYPNSNSTVTWKLDSADPDHHGTLVYSGLTNGVTGDRISYDITLNDNTGEMVLKATGTVATGQTYLQVNIPIVNLTCTSADRGTILGNGSRYIKTDPDAAAATSIYAFNMASPNLVVVEAENSCIGLWGEDQNEIPLFNPTTVELLHKQNSYDSIKLAVTTPVGEIPAQTEFSSVTWRINAYDSWLDVVRSYRSAFESLTGAKYLWNNNCEWTRKIHAVHSTLPTYLKTEEEAYNFYQPLSTNFSDKLLLYYWNGESIVLFGDPTYIVEGSQRPSPMILNAIKNLNPRMRWIGYHPYTLLYSQNKGMQERIAELSSKGQLPAGYAFSPVFPGGGGETDFFNYINPHSAPYYNADTGVSVIHPGADAIKDYLLLNISDYCTKHDMDGVYLDIMGSRGESHFPADRKILDGRTHEQGENNWAAEFNNANPDLALMSEVQTEWNVPRTFFTWSGYHNIYHPQRWVYSQSVKVNHPLRTALWSSYAWTQETIGEDSMDSALLGSLPMLIIGNDWSYARAKFFCDEELYNDLPETGSWDAANIFACYRGRNNSNYEYRNLYSNGLLYGEGYVNTSTGAITLGRFKNQFSGSLLGTPSKIQDWSAYDVVGNPIGLDPERNYPFIPGARAIKNLEIRSLPSNVYINAIRNYPRTGDPQWIAVEFGTHNSSPVSGMVSVYFDKTCYKVSGHTSDYGTYQAGTIQNFNITVPANGVTAGMVFVLAEDSLIYPVPSYYRNDFRISFGETPNIGTFNNYGWFINNNRATLEDKTLTNGTRSAICIGFGPYRGYSEAWVNIGTSGSPVLKFDMGYEETEDQKKSNVRFHPVLLSVLVNGTEIWREQVNSPCDWSPREVDLSAYAGRKVLITLSARQVFINKDLLGTANGPALFGNVYIDNNPLPLMKKLDGPPSVPETILLEDFTADTTVISPEWTSYISPENPNATITVNEIGMAQIYSQHYKYAYISRSLPGNCPANFSVQARIQVYRSGCDSVWNPGIGIWWNNSTKVCFMTGGAYRGTDEHIRLRTAYTPTIYLSATDRQFAIHDDNREDFYVKITLTSNKIQFYSSTDGANWVMDGEMDRTNEYSGLPDLLLLGRGMPGTNPVFQNEYSEPRYLTGMGNTYVSEVIVGY